ncbi:hypothetical protein [Myxococcus phage Mx1]|nr:hypothetical protein [Myxococcus phage Mx1]
MPLRGSCRRIGQHDSASRRRAAASSEPSTNGNGTSASLEEPGLRTDAHGSDGSSRLLVEEAPFVEAQRRLVIYESAVYGVRVWRDLAFVEPSSLLIFVERGFECGQFFRLVVEIPALRALLGRTAFPAMVGTALDIAYAYIYGVAFHVFPAVRA